MSGIFRVFGLGLIIQLIGRLAAALARFIARGNHLKLEPTERAALEALAAALDVVIGTLPAPGVDSSPGTQE
jgi:hypothetical protein